MQIKPQLPSAAFNLLFCVGIFWTWWDFRIDNLRVGLEPGLYNYQHFAVLQLDWLGSV